MRPRSLAIVVLGLLVLTGVGALAPAWAGAEQPRAPTVSFSATEGDCGSRPEVSHLGVPQRTPVLLVNATPAPVTVQVGGATVLGEPVAAGEGVLLTLDFGQHQVQLVPSCGQAEPLTVLVAGAAVPAPTTALTATPDEPTSGPSTAAPTIPARRSSPASTAPPPVETGDVLPVAGVGGVEPTATVVPGVLDASTVELASRSSPKGVRLLAAIATICVLGVTAAIIRSIVRLSP